MGDPGWTQVEAPEATTLLPLVGLEPEAEALCAPKATPRAFFARLCESKLEVAAVRFLAQALGKRDSVWWAIECVRASHDERTKAEDRSLLALVDAWIVEPSEQAGRVAFEKAQSLDFRTAACWVGVASFWCGPSLAPAGQPVVPPGPDLVGKATSAAIHLAAASGAAKLVEQRRKAYLDLGLCIAQGKNQPPTQKSSGAAAKS